MIGRLYYKIGRIYLINFGIVSTYVHETNARNNSQVISEND